jgi:hypothetical protein
MWAGWVIFAVTGAQLTLFFIRFDVDSFAQWVIGVLAFGGGAYIAGFIWAKLVRATKSAAKHFHEERAEPTMKDDPSSVPRRHTIQRSSDATNSSRVTPQQTVAEKRETIVSDEAPSPHATTDSSREVVLPEEHNESLYEQAWEEVESGNTAKGIWAQAFTVADGNPEKTRAEYLRLRVAALSRERIEEPQRLAEVRRVEKAKRAQVIEKPQITEEERRRERLAETLASLKNLGYSAEEFKISRFKWRVFLPDRSIELFTDDELLDYGEKILNQTAEQN